MAPPFRKCAPTLDAEPRVGGRVSYRKKGGRVTAARILWIYGDGTMRVKPDLGRVTIIDDADIARGVTW